MKKVVFGMLALGILLISMVSSASNHKTLPANNQNITAADVESTLKPATAVKAAQAPLPTCDGITVTSNCKLDSVNYKTYVYHTAVPEKSHTEQVTTYEKKVTSYCTLCSDSTYSPTCATGRGACSYHGGVAEWNAPVYSNVPIYSTKTVIDSPAQAAYYETVPE